MIIESDPGFSKSKEHRMQWISWDGTHRNRPKLGYVSIRHRDGSQRRSLAGATPYAWAGSAKEYDEDIVAFGYEQ